MNKIFCALFILIFGMIRPAMSDEVNSMKIYSEDLSARNNGCKLDDELKEKLIASSPYSVDDVTIDNCIYTWFISNKKYIFKVKENTSRELASLDELQKHSRNKDNSIQTFSANLFSGVSSIASFDSGSGVTEKAVSDLGYGLELYWSHHWTQKLHFFVVGSLKKFDFKTSEDRTLDKASFTQSFVGSGLKFKLSDRFILSSTLGLGESIILNSDGGNKLSIDKISIPSVSVGLKTKLYKFESGFSIDLNARVGTLLSTSQKGYETKNGSFYHLGLGSSYDLKNKKLFINTGITNRELEVESGKQNSKELGVSAGVGWSF